jgi:hypothetical protein
MQRNPLEDCQLLKMHFFAMLSRTSTLTLIIGLVLTNSCNKDNAQPIDCFPNATTLRQISNRPATINQQPGGLFYIVEQGSIDTKLDPCNLPSEFQIDNLQVIISGDVKATVQGGPGPCCTDVFVISKITK